MVGDCGIANQQRDGFLKRKLRHSFSAQSRRDFSGAIWGVLGVPHALQILDSNLPPDSIHFGRDGLGARSAICIGVLVMGTERLPRNKQGRLAELSLRVDKRGDEHSHDMHSLLEENALLRRILVKLDRVLKKVVDSR